MVQMMQYIQHSDHPGKSVVMFLQEVFKLIYAANLVVHMLSGKAIARAVWAHFIVDALSRPYYCQFIDIPLPFLTSINNFLGKKKPHMMRL